MCIRDSLNTTERISRKLAAQREELQQCGDREQLKVYGDLISANLYNMQKDVYKRQVYDGALYINEAQQQMTAVTNRKKLTGTLADAMKGADVFIGVSRPNTVTPDMIQSMARQPIVFAMANPTPEIMPDEAKKAGAYIVGTGRSDFSNQVNNVLAFPGIFKGALEAGATDITEGMKRAASLAIASVLNEDELSPDCVLPNPFDKRVAPKVAEAVKQEAIREGVIREALKK